MVVGSVGVRSNGMLISVSIRFTSDLIPKFISTLAEVIPKGTVIL